MHLETAILTEVKGKCPMIHICVYVESKKMVEMNLFTKQK